MSAANARQAWYMTTPGSAEARLAYSAFVAALLAEKAVR